MAYSFYSSPTEYAQFLIEMMKEDRSAPHSLNAESIELMLTPMTRTRTSTVHRDGSRSESSHYGLGWAIDLTTNGKRIRHSGSNTSGFRSYCEFYPQRGSGIVIMTNATGGSALWREIIEAIGEP
jgi:CubicO group peptidase (beta-lactamase class C family)